MGLLAAAFLLAPLSARAQLVRPGPELRDAVAADYERAAATPPVNKAAERESTDEHTVWALLMANALRSEPAYLLEVASALEKIGFEVEAWMVYGRFLRLRPNTRQREAVEERMRMLTARLAGELRGEARRQNMIGQQIAAGQSARQHGQLREAERHFGLAYALGDLDSQALCELARLQSHTEKWKVEYILWERLLDDPASAPALRAEAKARLQALTVRPRRPADVYIRAFGGLIASGRQLYLQGGVVDSDSQSSPDCLVQTDLALGLYAKAPCPRYDQPLTAGFGLALQLFPLAAHGPLLLRGLGLHLSLQVQPAVDVCGHYSAMAACAETTGLGQQLRAETALLWEYRFHQGSESGRLQLLAGYGYHSLRLPFLEEEGVWRSLPEPTYHVLTVGAEVLIPMLERGRFAWSIGLGLRYHALLGERLQPGEDRRGYGPVSSGHGLRAELTPLRLRLHAGLHLLVGTQVELFLLSLSCTSAAVPCKVPLPSPQRGFASGVFDLRYAGSLGLEYEY